MKFLVHVEIECRAIEDGTALIESALEHRKIFSGGVEPLKMSWVIIPSKEEEKVQ